MDEHQLKMPKSGPRLPPLDLATASPLVNAEHDKSIRTWGVPNNLFRTMAWSPQLGLTEVDYANSFIFDRDVYAKSPHAAPDGAAPVPFPLAGFVDRVTKELVINFVSLLNRSRYSITHHSVIGWFTLCGELPDATPELRAQRAELMLLYLVSPEGKPDYEDRKGPDGRPLYSSLHLLCFQIAAKYKSDPHAITDEDFADLKHAALAEARRVCALPPLNGWASGNAEKYAEAYCNGFVVELAWNIAHFSGLLNGWFTVLRVPDEPEFVETYNAKVPLSIRRRNNSLLGSSGWGS